jgi:enoyl-CoA hydratase
MLTGSDKALLLVRISKKWRTKPSSKCRENFFGAETDRFIKTRKPIIAAVSGYVLGVGANFDDVRFYHCVDTAKFGHEINLGVMAVLAARSG